MHVTFVAFNFKGSDVAGEERNYFERHVALARSLPGLRIYLTGRLRPVQGAKPEHFRAAIIGFESAEASGRAMSTPAAAEIMADTQAHLKDLRFEAFEAETVVPFESAPAGTRRFLLASAFDFKPDQGDLAAVRNYRARRVEIARKLPALRGYLIAGLGGAGAHSRQRIAMLMFESFERFRDALRSPIGRELNQDGENTICNLRFEHIDAQVEI
jgi:uncharacterized protein (TIGR02118 family)